ncbi:hypothetical protein HOU24_gp19 [Corynebacterium phage SamW]|uniref:Uncharacterized protein n=3 Tax=Samwavirus samW TaxID=2734273 RepID=A0A385UFW7_9CAUD|nr:hypothetical protein HOU24_gp19 [Corynebacterium phage SamW]YP_009848998.1 hypothetical protein HWC46_gp19 [Corynebacterium phage Lederberg]AYB70501.1 hypothetical protein SAMW_19 [Corynebacterium phage SamW]AYQ98796.1 hypothetical protein TROY_19 [Corynebacterium phage Troy]QDF20066.1 hypothetical protein SEA_LEDERBERG_19 [Corynebacterium phage Lederberg]
MTAPEPMIPPEIPRFDSIQDLRQWNADRIRRQMRKPADEAIEKMQRDLRDGLLSRIAGALRGEGLPGFEVVRDAVRDGLLPGIADAVRDAANLPGQYVPVRDAIRDLIFPVNERLDGVEESQLSAEEQLALLEGVRGYGAAYQPRNYGGNVNSVAMDFTAPVGPMKGVSIDPIFKGLQVDAPGLWLVSVRATGRATIATNAIGQQDRTELNVWEYPPPGTPGRQVAVMTGDGGTGRVSNTMTFPMIIEQAGTTIAVGAYSSRWRRWDGGKLYSSLSVTKLDSRPENPGDWTVPDA